MHAINEPFMLRMLNYTPLNKMRASRVLCQITFRSHELHIVVGQQLSGGVLEHLE